MNRNISDPGTSMKGQNACVGLPKPILKCYEIVTLHRDKAIFYGMQNCELNLSQINV